MKNNLKKIIRSHPAHIRNKITNDLITITGVSVRSFDRYYYNQMQPSLENGLKIAVYLGLEVEEIFVIDNIKEKQFFNLTKYNYEQTVH